MIKKVFTIGQAAKQIGFSHDAIRLYERHGLIELPRSENDYRQYDEKTIQRLRFIKHAKVMGFTLKEIGDLLKIRRTSQNTCHNVREQAKTKLADVEHKIHVLKQLQRALKNVVDTCDQQKPNTACPLLMMLDN